MLIHLSSCSGIKVALDINNKAGVDLGILERWGYKDRAQKF
jgi:hypothetical protein